MQIRPRLFMINYYTLNDGLSKMIFEWSTLSYLSWNYTGHGRSLIPLTKFEVDMRKDYIFRMHTTTFKYSSVYNNTKRQLIIRRDPMAEDADDRLKLKIRLHHNSSFLIHLQVINNHYEIIGDHFDESFYWKLHGYFQQDRFNGSLIIFNNDWWLSSKLDFNSSLYISTGRYVQFVSTSDPQIAFEILLKHRFHLAFQYAGLHSLVAFKLFHNSSNINMYFSSQALNETTFNISCQLNDLIRQHWMLEMHNKRYLLYNHNHEFLLNSSLQDFSFRHSIENKTTDFFIDNNTIEFRTNIFGLIISNLTSNTTKSVHLYNRATKQNLTMNYYKYGKFNYEGYNIQTPIYDINAIYYPTDDETRYVKVFFELLPLQMSSFNFIRGRTFGIGYETQEKKLVLSGNIAFTIEDIYDKHTIIMNERWKLLYGIEKSDRLYIKWNLKLNTDKRTLQAQVSVQDPNDQLSMPVYCDINAYLNDTMIRMKIRTVYSSSEHSPKPIVLELDLDQRVRTQQYLSVRLIHEPSNTNLGFTIDHYPKRKLHIGLKPNHLSHETTFVHLYANTTESQLKLFFILANLINFNLTLPKSYPENGSLHSSLFIDNEEYFDGRLDTSVLKLRSKEYLCNIKLNQLTLQKRFHEKVLASIFIRWIERNSSTALITIFSKTDFKQVSSKGEDIC